jgi:N-acetylmuramoyl-L-alanine amidase
VQQQVAPLAHPLILAPANFRRAGSSGHRRPVVVIDPGHGGTDCGMVTTAAIDEADFEMSMAMSPEEMMSLSPLPAGEISPEFLSGLPPELATGMVPTLPPEMPVDMSQIMGDLPNQPSLEEKAIVFSVALALAEFLQQKGIQVVLTRADDRNLSVAERLDIAQRSQADALISLHANADLASRPEINGIETYYNPAQSESRKLAWAVHKALTRMADMIDRGAHPATFELLRSTEIPAIHLEVGYITGDKDGMSLANLAYHRYLARAMASGIGRYVRQRG